MSRSFSPIRQAHGQRAILADPLSQSLPQDTPTVRAVQHYVRVLWNGQPMLTSTPLGRLDMVPLEDFTAYLDSLWPTDFVELCRQAS